MEFDKSIIDHMLGHRVTGIALKRRKPGSKKVFVNIVYFMFSDGTGIEIACTGELFPCNKQEAFDLHCVSRRGGNAYDNEYLAITDPDGAGQAVLINMPVEI